MKFFNMNSPIMRFMTKVADLMILNFLFILCSLPVVTMGAAWTALYYMTMKMVKDEESAIIRGFFRSFRQNFKQATLLWLGVMLVLVLLVLDLLLMARVDSPVAAALNTVCLVMAVLLLMLLQYLFPMLAKFDAGTLGTLKNAALAAVGHLPKTLLMTAATAGSVFISLYNVYTLSYSLPVWFVLGFALLAFGNSSVLVKIFDSLIGEEADNS